ncbi:hypothetical protein AK812_SmicGene30090 [Symbiodinium microadriaticum]|uniref:132 kDa protein n=1 Tax=Symbiodinium microadriaticum TaxID=2951 RepID=A0A1Q9D062_SYMMI|nr:hypothetical protein AK812_SmicGene30090 [Symbiodinium microadriaticum]
MRAAAECESLDADAPVPDIARALDQLAALPPEAPLPLSAAVLLTMTADGYLAAPAQSALLEAYGGGALAAAVQTLADEARDHFTPIAPRQGQANDRQNGRRRSSQRRRRARRSREHTASADDPADSGAVPTCPRPAAVEAEAAWEPLDGVDLQDELRHPVPTLQDVPPFLRAAVRGALVKALAHLHAALVAGQGNSAGAGRAWKLFLLAPRMLLARSEHQGAQGRALLLARAQAFQRGEWSQLLAAARPSTRPETPPQLDAEALAERKREQACAKVRQGELSRARHVLTAAELAPGTEDLEALELLTEAATCLAQANVPSDIAAGLAMARLTALRKPDGGVRGIATGDVFRRLVSRTLAKEWAHRRTPWQPAPARLFPCLFYGQPSSYCWWDAAGNCRLVPQGEGCEQGDALAPALFALGQHDALCQAAAALNPDDALMAFLDDLYVVTVPERARAALDSTTGAVGTHCGIAPNLGKTRVYATAEGPPPSGISELGEAVWRGNKPPAERGVIVLGTPIGHPDFVRQWAEERMSEERRFLQHLPLLPDLQCSWLLLSMCAAPRANHALRTLSHSACLAALEDRGGEADCLREAAAARDLLAAEGWHDCPTWSSILQGARPTPANDARPGDWPHGWQMHASRTRNTQFRDSVLLPDMPPSSQALLRSQAGPQAGAWLAAIPTEPATTLPPAAMQIALRRRLRQPLPLHGATCGPNPGCGAVVHSLGDHALACPRTGLLARRAELVERAWVRVAREAMGPECQVVPQQLLAHTTAPGVGAEDRRRLDLVVYGATRHGGALCCDATLVSPLTRTGHPQPCAAVVDGAALKVAERRKRATYPELERGGPQELVNEQARRFVQDLVRLKDHRAPPALRAAASGAWARRWWSMLSEAVQQAVASTALGGPWMHPLQSETHEGPPLDALLHLEAPAGQSRLPLRP